MWSEVKRALRPLVATASAAAEALWTFPIVRAGRLGQPRTTPWHSPGQRSVLVVAPHPDDEAIGCSGTLLKHHAAGDRVVIVYVTDGRRSRARDIEPQAMAALRHSEATRAAEKLQASMVWLGLPEGDWLLEEGIEQLRQIIQHHKPDVIYAPSQVDFHPEHHKVAHALALALVGASANIRVYAIQVPLTSALVNLVADITDTQTQAQQAIAAYASQQYAIHPTLRQRRYAAKTYGWPAEEFWQMPASLFCKIHQTDPTTWNTHIYRGLRRRAFGDGLAYLAGRATREALRQ